MAIETDLLCAASLIHRKKKQMPILPVKLIL